MKYLPILFSVLIVFSGCKGSGEDPAKNSSENHAEILANYADNFIIPSYNDFKTSLASFETSLQASTIDIEELRTESDELYTVWQSCSFYDFGPGLNYSLQNNINIYPVDTALVAKNIEKEITDIDASTYADQKGLPAIDFIVHSKQTLSTKDIQYLQLVVDEMQERIGYVIDGWSSSYRDIFVANIGTDNGSAISTLVNAYIKYYERDFRDGKLGFPLGIRNFNEQLPLTAEAYYSTVSDHLLRANLEAIKDVFYGGEGLGIDHLLKDENVSLLSKIGTQWTAIEDKAQEVDAPIKDYVMTNQEDGKALYLEIQELLVLLKIELTSSLGVKINYVDTDGD